MTAIEAAEKEESGSTAKGRVDLLDEDDDLTEAFTRALAETFVRFCKQAADQAKDQAKEGKDDKAAAGQESASKDAHGWLKAFALTEDDLDSFAKTVNESGKTMSDEEKAEIREYFSSDEQGRLTFAGFCEMYQLQTGSDEDETWKDLHALGYDDQLKRTEAVESKPEKA